MFKYPSRSTALALFLMLLSGPFGRAFPASSGQAFSMPARSTTSSISTANGVTGTDPEPIDPDIVSVILTILELS